MPALIVQAAHSVMYLSTKGMAARGITHSNLGSTRPGSEPLAWLGAPVILIRCELK